MVYIKIEFHPYILELEYRTPILIECFYHADHVLHIHLFLLYLYVKRVLTEYL